MEHEQMAQEDAFYPWLASDCMADPCGEEWPDMGWGDEVDEENPDD